MVNLKFQGKYFYSKPIYCCLKSYYTNHPLKQVPDYSKQLAIFPNKRARINNHKLLGSFELIKVSNHHLMSVMDILSMYRYIQSKGVIKEIGSKLLIHFNQTMLLVVQIDIYLRSNILGGIRYTTRLEQIHKITSESSTLIAYHRHLCKFVTPLRQPVGG